MMGRQLQRPRLSRVPVKTEERWKRQHTEIEHISCIREIREKHEMRAEDRPNW